MPNGLISIDSVCQTWTLCCLASWCDLQVQRYRHNVAYPQLGFRRSQLMQLRRFSMKYFILHFQLLPSAILRLLFGCQMYPHAKVTLLEGALVPGLCGKQLTDDYSPRAMAGATAGVQQLQQTCNTSSSNEPCAAASSQLAENFARYYL